MAISSPNVVQGKENPVVSALKYANDSIKQSFQLMQNAKELGLKEKEHNYNKNLNLLQSIQTQYAARAAEIGPLAAFDEYKSLYGSVLSSLGMDENSIASWMEGVANSPMSEKDYYTMLINSHVEGKDLSKVTQADIETVTQSTQQTTTVPGTKTTQITGKAPTSQPAKELSEVAGVEQSVAENVVNLVRKYGSTVAMAQA
jgi:hypothetical protein